LRSSQPTSDWDGGDPGVQALDLGGRGIRSLTHDPWRHAIWVLAGPPEDEGPTFALFLWDPESKRIEAVEAPGLESLKQPECVMAQGPPDKVSGETPLVVAGEGVRPVHIRARPMPVPPPPGEVR
jgi:hypothetical protein